MRVIVINEFAGGRENLRQVVLGAGLTCHAADTVTFEELSHRLAQDTADLIVVGMDGKEVAVQAIQYAADHSHCVILAVGPTADAPLILQAHRAGAAEYLDQATLRDEFPAALQRLTHRTGMEDGKWGQVYAVTSAIGGSGVTTVASGLAFALGSSQPGNVCLAELGGSVPELALNLAIEPGYSIADLAQQWQRLDITMLKQGMVEHSGGVNILAYRPETLHPEPLEPAAVRQTLMLLRRMSSHTILDLGHSLDAARLEALKLADVVAIVMRMDVPSVRLNRQLVKHLTEQGISRDRIGLVANRYGQRQQLSQHAVKATAGLPILDWIPDAPAILNRSVNNGWPLSRTSRFAPITRRLSRLAIRLRNQAA